MSSDAFISVIIPAFNAGRFLGEALHCVEQQHCEVSEVIVVDDGSTDNTPQIVASFRPKPRYVHQPNLGPAAARNHGLRLAQGNVIAFLDADDVWPSGTLEFLTKKLAEHPEIDMLLGRVQYMSQVETAGAGNQFRPFGEPCVSLSLDAGLIRRAVFDKIGCFDDTMRSSEDIDWFMRARERQIRIRVLDQVTLFYRRHEHNMTRNRHASHADFAKALKRSLDRRRRAGLRGSLGSLFVGNA